MIDVAVTEAVSAVEIVRHRHSEGDEGEEVDEEARMELERPRSSAAVYSPGTLKGSRSTSGLRILGEKEQEGKMGAKWMSSIKDLSARWRRKSVAVFSPSS